MNHVYKQHVALAVLTLSSEWACLHLMLQNMNTLFKSVLTLLLLYPFSLNAEYHPENLNRRILVTNYDWTITVKGGSVSGWLMME